VWLAVCGSGFAGIAQENVRAVILQRCKSDVSPIEAYGWRFFGDEGWRVAVAMLAGAWFEAQFEQLVSNAYPPIS
jgi:hypothetical protein